jgi:hypothetical protein
MSRPRSTLESLYVQRFGRAPEVLAVPAPSEASQESAADVVNIDHSRVEARAGSASDASVPAAYAKVLRLLQEADRSGLWPANSTGRQKVIVNAPTAVPTVDSDADLTVLAATCEGASSAAAGEDDAAEQSVGEEATACIAEEDIAVEVERAAGTEESKVKKDGVRSGKAPRKQRDNNGAGKAGKLKNKKAKTETAPAAHLSGNDSPTTVPAVDGQGARRDQPAGSDSASPIREGVSRPPLQPAHRRQVEAQAELISDPGVGGSFSVGCLPKHLAQPKGNTLFPGKHPPQSQWCQTASLYPVLYRIVLLFQS